MTARSDRPATHPVFQISPDLLEKEPLLLELIRQGQARVGFFSSGGPEPLTPSPQLVIVGVSGGADSLCLLHLLARLSGEFGLALHVAHLDHGLRPDSAADAAFVANLAGGWGLPVHLKRLEPGTLAAQGGNLEAAARSARFAFLLDLAASLTQGQANQEPIIALAHHADDQAETLLLHLLRGSGLDGLAAMRPISRRPLPGAPGASIQYARIVRPLLDADRAQIMRYLSVHGLTWREDATNQDPAFTRNRLRHQIVPLLRQINPNLTATLGRTAHILAGEADRLARLDRVILADLLMVPAQADRVVLDREKLAKLDEADRRGVLRLALGLILGQPAEDGAQIEYDHVATLAATLAEPVVAGGPFPLVAGLAWSVAPAPPGSNTPARLSLHRAEVLPFAPDHPWLAEHDDPRRISVPGGVEVEGWRLSARLCTQADLPTDWADLSPWEAYLSEDFLGAPTLARPETGLAFSPLGMGGQRKNLGDLFTDRKIPPSLRAGWPLILAEDGRVAWVCGVQIGHEYRVTPQTERIVHLSWRERTIYDHQSPDPLDHL